MAKFKGFSTIGRVKAPYTLSDGELIKRDLLNQFYTRLGERVMRPNYGSIIWDLLMDPSTPDLDKKMQKDIEKIIKSEPRAELLDVKMYILDHTIRAEIDLRILPNGDPEKLYLEYKREITEGIN
jgi:phage baseplate assembly protein W